MGWNYGYKNLGGLCDTGEVFESYVDVSNYNLRFDPFYDSDRFRPISKGVSGNDGLGGTMGGLQMGDFRNLQDQTLYTIYRIATVTDDNVRREIVLKGQYRQQYTDFVADLYLREYTDDTTFTDTKFTQYNAGSMVTGWYPSGGFNEVTQMVYAVFTTIVNDGIRYAVVGLVNEYKVPWLQDQIKYQISCIGIPIDVFTAWIDGEVPTEETSPEFGPASDIDGGYNDGFPHGSFDDSSDEIALDPKPTIGVSTAGFIRCYKINQGDLDNFGEKLFPDPENVAVTERLWYTMAYSKLIDYVIDCHVIPTSISGATLESLKVGWKTFSDIQLARATEDYVDIDCGTIEIEEYWRNFLDFQSVQAEIYLPFYGFVPIESEMWNGGKLNLKYRFNIVDGSFQAKLFSTSSKSKLTNSLIGQYGGVCCLHLPITGLQYANVITGILAGGANIAIGAASGNYGGIPNQLANMASLRPENPMSNGYSATSSFLSHRTPYLVIKRAVAQFSTQYNKENGFPLNVARKLSSVHGFTIIDKPVLNIDCSDAEYSELVQLLKNGIIL